MKIGIITFQETNNYGAALQNYALQQAILQKGHTVETIDYRSAYIGKPYRLIHLKRKGIFTYLFGVAGYLIYLPRTKKCNQFRRHIYYSEPVNTSTITKLNGKYDLFITGSDQVWNYKLTDMDPTYFLGFVTDKKKCRSYAASIGVSRLEDRLEKQYYELLKDYPFISVREKSASVLLKRLLSRDIPVVSDPCLLLTREQWTQIAVEPQIGKEYVFVYQLGFSADIVRLARRIAKKRGLKLVFTPFPVGSLAFGKWDISAGNAEIVGYIKNASYVVTDSFHGTLLSMIFHRQFFTKTGGTHGGVSSRIQDLLESYELTDRILQEDLNDNLEIDYSKVQKKLDEQRIYSLSMLEKLLK